MMTGTTKKSDRSGIVLICMMLGFLSSLTSQNISIRQTVFEYPGICYTTEFTAIIRNDETQAWTENVLTIGLPCGFEYIPGSVTGATEADIQNLLQPTFNVGEIPPNSERIMRFQVFPDCRALACLNVGLPFRNEYLLVSAQGQKAVFSDNYNVETPNIIITKVDKAFLEAEAGTVTERKITLKNTRVGRLTSFRFEDSHDEDLEIEIAEGQVLQKESGKIIVELREEDFKKIGNLDSIFDFNEELVLTEKITTRDCFLNAKYTQSDLLVSWGCGDEACQSNTARATLRILPRQDKGDKFTLTTQVKNPTCYFPGSAQQLLSIRVAPSISDLIKVKIQLEHPFPDRHIEVGSVIVPQGFVVLYEDITTNDCQVEVAKKAVLIADVLPATADNYVIDIPFLSAFCEENVCNPGPVIWKANYEYEKKCGEKNDLFHSGTVLAGNTAGSLVKSDLTMLVNGPVSDGKAGAVRYSLINAQVKNPVGELRLKITLPAFLEPIATNYAIGTKIPTVEVSLSGSDRHIELVYSLPFPTENPQLTIPFLANCSDTLLLPCRDSIITSCLNVCQESTNKEAIKAEACILLEPNCPSGGVLRGCTETLFVSECTHGYCTQQLSGYVDFDMKIRRLTLGLPDKDGDQVPDADGLFDENLLDRNSVFLGDTFTIEVFGEVIVDNPGEKFENAVIQLFHDHIVSQSNVGSDMIQSGISIVKNQLVLFDKSLQEYHVLENIPHVFQNLQYTYDVSPGALQVLFPALPEAFQYEDGDSIYLKVYKVFNKNFPTPFVGWNGHQLTFDYVPKIAVTHEEIRPGQYYPACGCPEYSINFVGYNAWSQWAIPGVAQCPAQTNVSSVLCNYGYPYSSPGEIKFYQKPRGFRIGKVKDIHLDSIAVSNGIFPEKVYKIFSENDDEYYVDISDFAGAKNLRAGLRFWIYRTTEKCIGKTIPPTFCELIFEQTATAAAYLSDRVEYSLQNIVSVPTIELDLQQKEYTALIPKIGLPLAMKNKVNNQVRNVFVRAIYDAQSFTEVNLRHASLPVNYPEINGYYVLGNLFASENRNLVFEAKGVVCGRKQIIFEYGYDCSVYSNPAETPCFIKSDTVYVDFQNGELELIATTGGKMIPLCDTVTESKFTVYNSGLGNVFSIQPTVFLPRGLDFVDGSCFIIYPSGSNQTIALPLPTLVSGRWYRWDLASLWPAHALEGLPAVSESPLNAFDIIYRTRSDCDFISGSQERYSIAGEQVCGKPSNQVAKAGPVLTLENLDNSVSVSIVASVPEILYCAEAQPIHIQYVNSHEDDSQLYVQLPAGVSVVAGSYTGNLPVNIPVNANGTLEWFIPNGQTNVDIQFEVISADSSSCTDDVVDISTSRALSAFCVSNQTFCDIQNTTGRLILPLSIQKQKIRVDSVWVVTHADSTYYSIYTHMFFEVGESPVTGKIVLDKDGNGIINDLDSLLQTAILYPDTIIPGSIRHIIRLDKDKLEDFCHVWLLVGDEECVCQKIVLPVQSDLIVEHDTLSLCWNEVVELGIAERPNRRYQWDIQSGLNCTQCGTTEFTLPNEESFVILGYQKTLKETNEINGCVQVHRYAIEVYPRQRVLSTSPPICAGDTLTIFTTPFSVEYLWTGEGIFQNEGDKIALQAIKRDWIYVSMTDTLGCTETDSVLVDVRETPPVSFMNDGLFCFGQQAEVGYSPLPDLQYSWIDPDMILFDIQKDTTFVNGTSGGRVFVKVENGSCSRTDSLDITFYQGVSVTGLQDSFIVCQGDSLTIELNGANQYDWLDPAFGTCLNDSCSRFLIIPPTLGLLTTQVVGITAEGCRDTFPVRVFSVSETQENTTKSTICQGDSISFLGRVIKQAGLYCDTVSTGACQFIQCLDVTVLSPSSTILKENLCPGDTLFINGDTYTQAGQFEWTVQTAQGCDSIIILQIDLLPGPVIDLPQNVEIIEGEFTTVTLPNQFTYAWSPGTGLNCTTCAIVSIEGTENLVYTITVTDISGCHSIYQLPVTVVEVCKPESMIIPNAFTPNGDQINDVFTIPELKVCEINITIFNRWGNVVYQQSPFNNQWDGRSSNGSDLPSGTYYYLIETLDSSVRRTGMIDLRRQ